MKTYIDISNQRFGKLVAVEPIHIDGRFKWRCICDCGKEVYVRRDQLISGKVSCGCDNSQVAIGKRFERLVVIKDLGTGTFGNKYRQHRYECLCDCGCIIVASGRSLVRGRKKSCGCLTEEKKRIRKENSRKNDRLYTIYKSMLNRCYSENNCSYNNYGGRGIEVCDEWKNDYCAFKQWAYNNGYNKYAKKYECTLDRIDVNKNYYPENCRWVNTKIQANNRRNNRVYEYNKESHTMTEWAEILEIPRYVLQNRLINLNWSVEKAFTTPVAYYNCKSKGGEAVE